MVMISVIFPSRKRPEQLHKVCKNILNTSNSEILVAVDEDDFASHFKQNNVKKFIMPRQDHLANYYNSLYKHISGEIVMIASDDIVFETPEWDKEIHKIFEREKFILAYASDGHFNESFACHPFLHKKWIETLGYVVPHKLSRHLDRWHWDIAKKLQLNRYLPQIMIRHNFVDRKFDETLTELENHLYQDTIEYDSRFNERQKDCRKIGGLWL